MCDRWCKWPSHWCKNGVKWYCLLLDVLPIGNSGWLARIRLKTKYPVSWFFWFVELNVKCSSFYLFQNIFFLLPIPFISEDICKSNLFLSEAELTTLVFSFPLANQLFKLLFFVIQAGIQWTCTEYIIPSRCLQVSQ